MIFNTGIDIIEVERIQEMMEKYGERFQKRLYTQTEIDYCESFKETKYVHYAARFAAKEAFSKAIGTGLTQGFKFVEVGIRNEKSGLPVLELSGGMLEKWGDYKIHVSLSHTRGNAIAVVIMEKID